MFPLAKNILMSVQLSGSHIGVAGSFSFLFLFHLFFMELA